MKRQALLLKQEGKQGRSIKVVHQVVIDLHKRREHFRSEQHISTVQHLCDF